MDIGWTLDLDYVIDLGCVLVHLHLCSSWASCDIMLAGIFIAVATLALSCMDVLAVAEVVFQRMKRRQSVAAQERSASRSSRRNYHRSVRTKICPMWEMRNGKRHRKAAMYFPIIIPMTRNTTSPNRPAAVKLRSAVNETQRSRLSVIRLIVVSVTTWVSQDLLASALTPGMLNTTCAVVAVVTAAWINVAVETKGHREALPLLPLMPQTS